MPTLKRGEVVVVLGKSGSGKTTIATKLIGRAKRVLIHDPNGEEILEKGATVCETPEHLVRLVAVKGAVRICWRGYATMPIPAAFEWANRAAWAGEGFAVMWDEVDKTMPRLDAESWAYKLINSGRHRGCWIVAASRRPQRVPRDLTAAATRLLVAHTTGPRDIGYLAEYMGADAEQLPSLGRYEFLDWSDSGEVTLKKNSTP